VEVVEKGLGTVPLRGGYYCRLRSMATVGAGAARTQSVGEVFSVLLHRESQDHEQWLETGMRQSGQYCLWPDTFDYIQDIHVSQFRNPPAYRFSIP
jgi:hypothetical protein